MTVVASSVVLVQPKAQEMDAVMEEKVGAVKEGHLTDPYLNLNIMAVATAAAVVESFS